VSADCKLGFMDRNQPPVGRSTLTAKTVFAGAIVAGFIGATAAVFVPPAPLATAAPACDPTTSDGYLNCIGGGIPWQDQSGSSPDTYGPTGSKGFIYDNRSVGSFPNMSDTNLLKLGGAICQDLANGFSEQVIKSNLIGSGVPALDAGAVVISAQMYLC